MPETEIKNQIDKLNRAFEAFKTEHNEKLSSIRQDVLKDEKIERINGDITALQKTVDDLNEKLATTRAGAAGNGEDPHQTAYRDAFYSWFRGRLSDDEFKSEARKFQAAMQTQSDPDGGYLVPEEMDRQITRVMADRSAMRRLAQVRRIGSLTFKKVVNLGGTASGWVSEQESRPETATATFSELEFPAHELYAMPAATQTLLDDAFVDLGAWLAGEVEIEFGETEGNAFINGTGAGQPRGILGYDTVANSSYQWGKIGFVKSGKADGLAADDPADALLSQVYALKARWRNNARWIMNDLTTETVRKIKDGQGQYIWQPSVQVGEPSTLFGYAVEHDDHMPDIGAGKFPIAFGDFRSGYLVVDRLGTRVLRDPFSAKPKALFYTTKRTGGGVQMFEAIKLMKIAA